MKLTSTHIQKIRRHWKGDPSFLGFPDAERDAAEVDWYEHLLVRPTWFGTATKPKTTILVGRKGVGKSATRIAATRQLQTNDKTLVVQVSADELAARHGEKLTKAITRGFGAVADWRQVFAEAIVRQIAVDLGGTVLFKDDDETIRKWATVEGVSERDFGERIVSAVGALVPWIKKLATEQVGKVKASDAVFQRVIAAKQFALYIDDFDNIQESKSLANLQLIRDAVEAADRITHQNNTASVHLMMRQDLWLRLCPGWHYADKIAGLTLLNWTQDELRKWTDSRLRRAAAMALSCDPRDIEAEFNTFWTIFFPETIVLRDEKESTGLHYLVRRTMYTPRALQKFMKQIVERVTSFPADLRAVEDAEEAFSVEQLEFIKTEFGGLCTGLDICLQSFTGKRLESTASDLYKHLKGMLGNGQVRLMPGASDGNDQVALARFLFRIGFLEVRYPQSEGKFEVRDAMRHPDHWKSIRNDDSVKWAVRSAFYCALRSHRRD